MLPVLMTGLTLPVPALATPVLLAAAVEIVRLGFTIGLPDVPGKPGSVLSILSAVPGTIGSGVKLAGRNRLVLRLLVVGSTVGVALAVIELVTPGWLDTLAGDPERAALAYAVLATVGFAADALGATLAPVARRRLRTPARASAAATSVALAGLLGLVVASLGGDDAGLLVAGVAYVGVFIGLGAAGPPMGELLHGQVRSEQRATLLSVQSLMFQLAGAGGSILAGSLTVWHGPPAGFAVAAVSMAIAIPMLLRLHAHGSHPPPPRDRRSQEARSYG